MDQMDRRTVEATLWEEWLELDETSREAMSTFLERYHRKGDPVVEALPEDVEELMWELFEEAEEIRLEDEG